AKSFTVLSGGPPAGKPINVKVRGDDFERIEAAVADIKAVVQRIPGATDVQDDNLAGRPQLQLRVDHDAVREAGLADARVARLVRGAVDAEAVDAALDGGDKSELPVRSDRARRGEDALRIDPASLLAEPVALPDGQTPRLGMLVKA